ncbi:alpha beta-hydrolase [Lentinus tigrinus ALCF2SS1-7]|uniref:Carboxylic ester hydrolase n=1 Tax=Lentinus tigrinus ALCF2SS1-6 TaxID=1328759 RepID=A0A5C2S4X2_9APHY|nr:alpha beta-hydrolase [Lentinus tigrinus ALCF2SS1-6]RPD68934.1 alpha beta-hydrolase [Lentinus tigrinus ALCF2SS1-7]
MFLLTALILSSYFASGIGANPTTSHRHSAGPPQVRLDRATVVGTVNGSVESFLGIRYARPPVGDLRLRLPQLIDSYNGTINATVYGNQCFQQVSSSQPDLPAEVAQSLSPLLATFSGNADVGQSEDCLNLNIIRPANVSTDAKLPVLFWIYGGGFADGSNSIPGYNGTAIVQRSLDLNQPVIYVALNYRLSVFGFLGGKEVQEAGIGNLGLQDQRAALRWVNRYISAFGGDPSKVTIWGESAGSSSVFFQLYANDGNNEGLFRAGIMSSGFALSTGNITEIQGTYDSVVDQVGCSNATDSLACLRSVPADTFLATANDFPTFTDYTGLVSQLSPRADGTFLTTPPYQLVNQGKIADVPFIVGDVKDEGTIFGFGSLNVTTDDEVASYVSELWFPGSSTADVSRLLQLYPSDPAAGSPFDTGDANAFSPQYKRIAALTGDWFFNAPRRQLLDKISTRQTVYNFLSARANFAGVGYPHTSDLLNAFGPGDMTDYFIRFVNDLDPNGATGIHWPAYNATARATLQFNDGDVPLNITVDDQRLAGTDEMSSLIGRFPI